MFPIIYGILAKLGRTSNWWEAGGASGAVAVYQPIGAADLANSYTDLSGNGNDAAPGVAPTWDAVNGWTFNGTNQYLDSGVVPANDQTWTMIVHLTSWASGDSRIAGSLNDNDSFFSLRATTTLGILYGNGSKSVFSAPAVSSGVFAVAGNNGYRDGIIDKSGWTGWTGTPIEIYIGALNLQTNPAAFGEFKMQAIAIYNNTLDAAEVLAVSNAMAAL